MRLEELTDGRWNELFSHAPDSISVAEKNMLLQLVEDGPLQEHEFLTYTSGRNRGYSISALQENGMIYRQERLGLGGIKVHSYEFTDEGLEIMEKDLFLHRG